jgi:quinoprotein glucose dehydrogenase
LKGSLHVPGNIGGLHWGGMAWDHTHRLLIAPVNHWPAVVRLLPRSQFEHAREAFPKRETTGQDGSPYSISREFFPSPSGAPCIKLPWGELVAIHADSAEMAWRVPLGDLSEWWPTAPIRPTGSPNPGGPATTDTGVVFVGATIDGYFRAFATRDGRELWKTRLPASARATPLIFTTKNDAGDARQMVVIAAGGHDVPNQPIDTKLVAFALRSRPTVPDTGCAIQTGTPRCSH